MHIQVVISLIAIAGAAAVALACDFLRARNAQLRETVAKMKVKKAGQNGGPRPTGPRRPPVKAMPAVEELRPIHRVAATVPLSTAPVPLTAPEFTTRRGRPQLSPQASEPAISNPALSAWLIECSTARAGEKTLAEAMPENAAVAPAAEPTEQIVIDAHLWAALCEEAPAKPRLGLELIRGNGAGNLEVRVPAGMQSSAGLSPLLESGQLFTGLVISIGADAREYGQAVEGFIAGLLRSADFGCRNGEDDFLLICPGLHGAEARRHLSHVSERLWDYQLRTLGQFSIVFSLGGIDVQRENLADAVASAKERMGQTRRRTEPVAQKRKAG